jgi:Predicted transcriptional regulator
MKKFYKMSDSEMEIMKIAWESDDPITVAQLLHTFEDRKWKAQTIATFLTRLAEKGLIDINKQARTNLYTPIITEKEYYQLEAQNLLSSMYDGSLQNFLSALHGGDEIHADEIAELIEWFEKVKND